MGWEDFPVEAPKTPSDVRRAATQAGGMPDFLAPEKPVITGEPLGKQQPLAAPAGPITGDPISSYGGGTGGDIFNMLSQTLEQKQEEQRKLQEQIDEDQQLITTDRPAFLRKYQDIPDEELPYEDAAKLRKDINRDTERANKNIASRREMMQKAAREGKWDEFSKHQRVLTLHHRAIKTGAPVTTVDEHKAGIHAKPSPLFTWDKVGDIVQTTSERDDDIGKATKAMVHGFSNLNNFMYMMARSPEWGPAWAIEQVMPDDSMPKSMRSYFQYAKDVKQAYRKKIAENLGKEATESMAAGLGEAAGQTAMFAAQIWAASKYGVVKKAGQAGMWLLKWALPAYAGAETVSMIDRMRQDKNATIAEWEEAALSIGSAVVERAAEIWGVKKKAALAQGLYGVATFGRKLMFKQWDEAGRVLGGIIGFGGVEAAEEAAAGVAQFLTYMYADPDINIDDMDSIDDVRRLIIAGGEQVLADAGMGGAMGMLIGGAALSQMSPHARRLFLQRMAKTGNFDLDVADGDTPEKIAEKNNVPLDEVYAFMGEQERADAARQKRRPRLGSEPKSASDAVLSAMQRKSSPKDVYLAAKLHNPHITEKQVQELMDNPIIKEKHKQWQDELNRVKGDLEAKAKATIEPAETKARKAAQEAVDQVNEEADGAAAASEEAIANAEQVSETSPDDGGGVSQPTVRQETGDQAQGGVRVQQGGQGDRQAATKAEAALSGIDLSPSTPKALGTLVNIEEEAKSLANMPPKQRSFRKENKETGKRSKYTLEGEARGRIALALQVNNPSLRGKSAKAKAARKKVIDALVYKHGGTWVYGVKPASQTTADTSRTLTPADMLEPDQRASLKASGLTDEQIGNMTPEQALEAVQQLPPSEPIVADPYVPQWQQIKAEVNDTDRALMEAYEQGGPTKILKMRLGLHLKKRGMTDKGARAKVLDRLLIAGRKAQHDIQEAQQVEADRRQAQLAELARLRDEVAARAAAIEAMQAEAAGAVEEDLQTEVDLAELAEQAAQAGITTQESGTTVPPNVTGQRLWHQRHGEDKPKETKLVTEMLGLNKQFNKSGQYLRRPEREHFTRDTKPKLIDWLIERYGDPQEDEKIGRDTPFSYDEKTERYYLNTSHPDLSQLIERSIFSRLSKDNPNMFGDAINDWISARYYGPLWTGGEATQQQAVADRTAAPRQSPESGGVLPARVTDLDIDTARAADDEVDVEADTGAPVDAMGRSVRHQADPLRTQRVVWKNTADRWAMTGQQETDQESLERTQGWESGDEVLVLLPGTETLAEGQQHDANPATRAVIVQNDPDLDTIVVADPTLSPEAQYETAETVDRWRVRKADDPRFRATRGASSVATLDTGTPEPGEALGATEAVNDTPFGNNQKLNDVAKMDMEDIVRQNGGEDPKLVRVTAGDDADIVHQYLRILGLADSDVLLYGITKSLDTVFAARTYGPEYTGGRPLIRIILTPENIRFMEYSIVGHEFTHGLRMTSQADYDVFLYELAQKYPNNIISSLAKYGDQVLRAEPGSAADQLEMLLNNPDIAVEEGVAQLIEDSLSRDRFRYTDKQKASLAQANQYRKEALEERKQGNNDKAEQLEKQADAISSQLPARRGINPLEQFHNHEEALAILKERPDVFFRVREAIVKALSKMRVFGKFKSRRNEMFKGLQADAMATLYQFTSLQEEGGKISDSEAMAIDLANMLNRLFWSLELNGDTSIDANVEAQAPPEQPAPAASPRARSVLLPPVKQDLIDGMIKAYPNSKQSPQFWEGDVTKDWGRTPAYIMPNGRWVQGEMGTHHGEMVMRVTGDTRLSNYDLAKRIMEMGAVRFIAMGRQDHLASIKIYRPLTADQLNALKKLPDYGINKFEIEAEHVIVRSGAAERIVNSHGKQAVREFGVGKDPYTGEELYKGERRYDKGLARYGDTWWTDNARNALGSASTAASKFTSDDFEQLLYSQHFLSVDVINNAPKKVMPAKKWLEYLRNNKVGAQELNWAGLSEYLDDAMQRGNVDVSGDELLDKVNAYNSDIKFRTLSSSLAYEAANKLPQLTGQEVDEITPFDTVRQRLIESADTIETAAREWIDKYLSTVTVGEVDELRNQQWVHHEKVVAQYVVQELEDTFERLPSGNQSVDRIDPDTTVKQLLDMGSPETVSRVVEPIVDQMLWYPKFVNQHFNASLVNERYGRGLASSFVQWVERQRSNAIEARAETMREGGYGPSIDDIGHQDIEDAFWTSHQDIITELIGEEFADEYRELSEHWLDESRMLDALTPIGPQGTIEDVIGAMAERYDRLHNEGSEWVDAFKGVTEAWSPSHTFAQRLIAQDFLDSSDVEYEEQLMHIPGAVLPSHHTRKETGVVAHARGSYIDASVRIHKGDKPSDWSGRKLGRTFLAEELQSDASAVSRKHGHRMSVPEQNKYMYATPTGNPNRDFGLGTFFRPIPREYHPVLDMGWGIYSLTNKSWIAKKPSWHGSMGMGKAEYLPVLPKRKHLTGALGAGLAKQGMADAVVGRYLTTRQMNSLAFETNIETARKRLAEMSARPELAKHKLTIAPLYKPSPGWMEQLLKRSILRAMENGATSYVLPSAQEIAKARRMSLDNPKNQWISEIYVRSMPKIAKRIANTLGAEFIPQPKGGHLYVDYTSGVASRRVESAGIVTWGDPKGPIDTKAIGYRNSARMAASVSASASADEAASVFSRPEDAVPEKAQHAIKRVAENVFQWPESYANEIAHKVIDKMWPEAAGSIIGMLTAGPWGAAAGGGIGLAFDAKNRLAWGQQLAETLGGTSGGKVASGIGKWFSRNVVPLEYQSREASSVMLEAKALSNYYEAMGEEVTKLLGEGGTGRLLGFDVAEEYATEEVNNNLFWYLSGKKPGKKKPTPKGQPVEIEETEVTLEMLPEPVRPFAERLRKEIRALGEEYVKLGLLRAETIDQRGGKYVGWFFEKHEMERHSTMKRVAKKLAPKGERQQFRESEGYALKRGGVVVEHGLEGQPTHLRFGDGQTMERWLRNEAREATYARFKGTDRAIVDKALSNRYNSKNDLEKTIRQYYNEDYGDYTKIEPRDIDTLEKMGLIQDASYSVAQTIMQMGHDIAMHRMYRDLASTAGRADSAKRLVFDKESDVPKGMHATKMPSNHRTYGAIADKWVPTYLHEEIMGLREAPSDAVLLYDEMMKLWKMGKTVYNPATHGRNILGNFIFSDLAGCPWWNPFNRKYYWKAFEVLCQGKHPKLYREIARHKVTGADFFNTELRERFRAIRPSAARGSITDFLKTNLIERLGTATGALSGGIAGMAMGGPVGSALGATVGFAGGRLFMKNARSLYVMEDEIFKVAAYLKHRDTMPLAHPRESAAWCRKWFPYYDQIPNQRMLNATRRWVMPFMSFYYESLRIGAHGLRERPVTMAKWLVVPYFMSLYSKWQHGLDDEDWESIKKDMRGQVKVGDSIYPIWSVLVPHTRDSEGRLIQWDMTNAIPYANILGKRIDRGNREEPWYQKLIQTLTMSSPVSNMAMAFSFNADPYFQRRLYHSYQSPGERAGEFAKFAGKTLLPPLTPGLGSSWRSISPGQIPAGTLQKRSELQTRLRTFTGVDLRAAGPNLYRLIDEYHAEQGKEPRPGGIYDVSESAQIRRDLYQSIIDNRQEDFDDRLADLGRTEKAIKSWKDMRTIVRQRHPLQRIKESNRRHFLKSLSPEEKAMVEKILDEYKAVNKRAYKMWSQHRKNERAA